MAHLSRRISPVALGELGTIDPSTLDVAVEEAAAGAKEESVSPEVLDIPDGGLRAWCTVIGAWFVSFTTFGHMNAYGVYQAYYIQTHLTSYSTSTISWIGSVQMLLMLGMGIISGKLFDKGYFRHLVVIGMIVYVGCIFAQSAAKPNQFYQVFLSQGIGQGLATGMLYLPTVSVISHHFRRKRAMALGLVILGSSTGGILLPIMINNLLNRSGYAWTVRAVGFLILGCLIIANLLMSTRLPPGQEKDQANVAGYFKEIHYVLMLAGIFFVFWGISFPMFYIQVFTSLKVSNETFAFYTVSLLNAGSMFGRILPNLLADRTGPMVLYVPCCFMAGALVFVMYGCTSVGVIAVFCILFGFFSGSYIGLMVPALANTAHSVSEMGARIGIGLTFMGLAGLSATPLSGAIIGSGPEYSWSKGIIFSGVSGLAGAGLMAAAWYTHPKHSHHLASAH